eukprot:CAMPEP_0204279330 /NCGR_PEP_ID=MMETSP0468-20130131/34871_1 /ASSEMBLY_ACC=CAM_ASM_000383 /TAXON_ID=2969 /ORGANISM="Oxyrrhis marina" /LENGTH=52 /DNA_ID=CAMNT_0051256405 /DNA_START=136 /DNA_END=292 /DNA_ORIENTATION=-
MTALKMNRFCNTSAGSGCRQFAGYVCATTRSQWTGAQVPQGSSLYASTEGVV